MLRFDPGRAAGAGAAGAVMATAVPPEGVTVPGVAIAEAPSAGGDFVAARLVTWVGVAAVAEAVFAV